MREHEASHAVGERRLADALGADEQEGVRDASAAIGGKERGLGDGVAEQRVGHARVRRVDGFARRRAHEARFSKMKGAIAGSSLEFTVAHTRLATVSFVALASMITQRFGSAAASVR